MKPQYIMYIAALAALASCTPAHQEPGREQALSVKTYQPYTTAADGDIVLGGTVSARQTATVSTRLMGNIEKIYVRQGDNVRQGQLLLTLSSADLSARQAQARAMIAEAEAAARDAQKDYRRYQSLREQNSVSDKELENMALRSTSATARLQVARQQLREVNALLAYTRITAPFSGVVTQRPVDEGSIANPGMPLLTIEQAGELNVTATVPENHIALVHKGDRVTVEVRSIGATMAGTVSELSPSATQTGGQYAMKVALSQHDRSRLRAGMYAAVRLAGRQRATGAAQLMVKRSSVVSKDQLTGVYVMSAEGRAVLHWVRLGREVGDRVVVLSGLNAADRVIEGTSARLYNGLRVQPISERR